MQQHTLLALTIVAAADVTKHRFVSFDKAQSGAGDRTLGVSKTNEIAGNNLAVDVIGTTVVEAGAALTSGAEVETDADGRAIPKAAGELAGIVMPDESASAAGEFVEIILK